MKISYCLMLLQSSSTMIINTLAKHLCRKPVIYIHQNKLHVAII